MDNGMKALVFSNVDATPKKMVIYTTKECTTAIMVMYRSYFSGDRYTVSFDGQNIPIDHNGWPI